MSVRVIPWKPGRLKNRWLVDIRFRKLDGTKIRDRQIHPAPTKAQARNWGEAREAQLRAGILVYRSHAKAVATPNGLVLVTRKPCPSCGKTEDSARSVRSDPEMMTIGSNESPSAWNASTTVSCPDCGLALNVASHHTVYDCCDHLQSRVRPLLESIARIRKALPMPKMNERVARLLQQFRPGERVRAVETIVYGTGEEVPEGSVGRIQQTNVHGCTPLVTVEWEGLPPVTHPCSVESLVSLEPGS